jgi:transcriptional regulator with XRE-family HTH domain
MTVTANQNQNFAARMKAIGVTQEFLADYIGVSQSEISKRVCGIRPQGEGHREIDRALRELESVAVCFYPMKLLFDNVPAVKEWLVRPALPILFKMLTDAQLSQVAPECLTSLNIISRESERLGEEIEISQEQTQTLWLEFLQEVADGKTRGDRHAVRRGIATTTCEFCTNPPSAEGQSE